MNSKHHPLFQQYPLVSTRVLSNGARVPVPYHIYDGSLLFIGGTAELSAVSTLLQAESVTPIQTSDGKALMAVWACDFREASLGAHQELQFSLFVSRTPQVVVRPHPFTILDASAFNPVVRMMCHGLWNNTENVVLYNREILGLNAQRTTGQIDIGKSESTFNFTDEQGSPIFKGHVQHPAAQPSGVLFSLMGLFGWRNMITSSMQPWLSMQVMNPIGTVIAHNAEAQAYTAMDTRLIHMPDAHDMLEFGHPLYKGLGFAPQFIYRMTGIKFVYLNVHNQGDASL